MRRNLKDIRRRITAVRNTQKVTRAMKLVASAKLRGVQEKALAGHPYAAELHQTVKRVSRHLGPGAPILWRRPVELNCMDSVVITSDRGLCGGFNENLLYAIEEGFVEHIAHNIDVKLYVIGKKGQQYLKRRGYDVVEVPTEGGDDAMILWVAEEMIRRYATGESAGGYLGFNRFVSAAHQEITFWNLLPLYEHGAERERYIEYLYEPERIATLNYLCVEALSSTIRQALLESRASEMAARMMAMDAATKNADDMIEHLTAEYNKARQEAITRELMDIVGGAEALRRGA